jgi:hypothetical protein
MPLLLIALGVAAYLYWQKGNEFMDTYQVKFIDGVFNYNKTRDSFFVNIFFTLRIEVDNTTDFSGTLQSAKLKLSYNGNLLGTINKTEPVTIVKNGKTRIEIPVSVPVIKMVSNILSIISQVKSKSGVLQFKVQGDLNFGIGTVTVNQDYKVSLS